MEYFAIINIILAAFLIGCALGELVGIISGRIRDKIKIKWTELISLIFCLACGCCWIIISYLYRLIV